MKIKLHQRFRVLVLLAISTLTVVLVAWKNEPVSHYNGVTYYADTLPTPRSERLRMRDFDKELQELDEALLNINKYKSPGIDSIRGAIDRLLSELHLTETINHDDQFFIQDELDKLSESLGHIDLGEFRQQMEDLDLKQLKTDLERLSLDTIHLPHLRIELPDLDVMHFDDLPNAGLDRIHFDGLPQVDLKSELLENDIELGLKKLELDKLALPFGEPGLEKSEETIRQELDEAALESLSEVYLKNIDFEVRGQLEKAKLVIKGYQDLIYELEAEGLINIASDYTVSKRNGSLYINGEKQPVAVSEKYGDYLTERVTIQKKAGKMSVNQDHQIHNDTRRLPD